MRNIVLHLLTIVCFTMASITFAGPGGGHGNGFGKGNNPGIGKGFNHQGKFVTSTGRMPPGLSKHGKYPHGLSKQGKTPAGWSKGRKQGWDTDKNSIIPAKVKGLGLEND